jgi:tyrosine-protein kinase
VEETSSGRDFGGQIREFARVLREQWWIILLCTILTAFAAAGYTSTQEKEYEASAKLLLQSDNLSSTIAGTGVGGVDPNRQTATDAQLLGSRVVAQRVAKQLKQVIPAGAVHTSTNPDSNVLTVVARDRSPRRAARIANEFARQFIIFRRDMTRARYNSALRTVQTRLAQTRPGTADFGALSAQVKQLKLLVSLQTGDAQLVQEATVPGSPVSPDPVRNIALGLIFGALLGLGLAFLRDRLDRRVKNEDQLGELLPGVPVVGLVPEPGRRRESRLMTAEGYHSLQANLALLARDQEFKTLLVTSASPGEGKSTVALNLALAMIEKGQSALVLDTDLRRPSISQRLNADRRTGVASILAGNGTLETSVQERPVEPGGNGTGPSIALDGALPLVSAGPSGGNIQLLINDRSLGALLEASRDRSGVAIFDGPPVGSFADMLPLAKEVDGVLIAVRLYYSRKDQIKRLAAQLDNAGITPTGIVVLGAAVGPSRYYSEYLSKR